MPGMQPPLSSRRKRQQGFSLVELAIVLAIMSTVAVMGLEAAAMFLDRTAKKVTEERIAAIDQALVKYRNIYGRLPCPAARTVSIADSTTNNGYAKEYCNAALAISGTSLRQGMVPVRDLNLPLSMAVDGYGNKFNYVVTNGYTSSSTFAQTGDGISIRTGTLATSCTTSCQIMGTAAYILISPGYDRRGGISPRGVVNRDCIPSTASDMKIDAQNCIYLGSTVAIGVAGISADTFYDSRYNRGLVEANYFDDIVIWRPRRNL